MMVWKKCIGWGMLIGLVVACGVEPTVVPTPTPDEDKSQLWLMNAAGGETRQLASADALFAVVSPGGDWVAMTTVDGAEAGPEVALELVATTTDKTVSRGHGLLMAWVQP
jgi:hypothetical protein